MRHRIVRQACANENDRNQTLLCDAPDALLWDIDFKGVEETLSHLKKFCRVEPVLFYIAENKSSVADAKWNAKEVFTLDRVDNLMSKLRESVLRGRNQRLTECRDPATGLYLPEFFSETVRRELKSSERCKDKFTVMRFALHNHDGIQSEYGPIFARELILNLGLFIQDRVRGSDVVPRGGEGRSGSFSRGSGAILPPSSGRGSATVSLKRPPSKTRGWQTISNHSSPTGFTPTRLISRMPKI